MDLLRRGKAVGRGRAYSFSVSLSHSNDHAFLPRRGRGGARYIKTRIIHVFYASTLPVKTPSPNTRSSVHRFVSNCAAPT